jgi:hypothetical protein
LPAEEQPDTEHNPECVRQAPQRGRDAHGKEIPVGFRLRKGGVERARGGTHEDAGDEADQNAAEIALKFAQRVEGREQERGNRRGRRERPHDEAEQARDGAHRSSGPRTEQNGGDDDGDHRQRRHDGAERRQRAERREAEQRLDGDQDRELREAQHPALFGLRIHLVLPPLNRK